MYIHTYIDSISYYDTNNVFVVDVVLAVCVVEVNVTLLLVASMAAVLIEGHVL